MDFPWEVFIFLPGFRKEAWNTDIDEGCNPGPNWDIQEDANKSGANAWAPLKSQWRCSQYTQ